MPDDNRLDLNDDLQKLSGDLLKDVAAATEEVKQRKESDAAKDRRGASKEKDRRNSIIIIAAAAVLIIVIAYWLVFARQPQAQPTPTYTAPQKDTRMRPPTGNTVPRTPPRPAPTNNNNQSNPPNEYDQPGQ
jgi:cytoskeletal protein RodZ